MAILRLPPPTSGYELKLEVLRLAIAWELFGTDEAKEAGQLFISEDLSEIANRVAERTLAVLDDFREE